MTERVDLPLTGVNVVELGQVVATPLAGSLLGDMGANVVKVEPPSGDPLRHVNSIIPDESPGFIGVNRSKRSLSLDLKHPGARTISERLIVWADVILTNLRPGAPEGLGMDYARVSRLNPRAIYVRNSAYGPRGPEASRTGFDNMLQARTGLAILTGSAERAGQLEMTMLDQPAALAMVAAVSAALYMRERTGRGQLIDTSLMATSYFMMAEVIAQVDAYHGAWAPQMKARLSEAAKSGASLKDQLSIYREYFVRSPGNYYYRAYETADGQIAVGCLSPGLRRKLCEATGIQDPNDASVPLTDEGFEDARELVRRFEKRFRDHTTEEWLSLLAAGGCPAERYQFKEYAFDDPQATANGMIADLDHAKLGHYRTYGAPIQLDGSPISVGRPSPTIGEHSHEVLVELGFGMDEIDGWINSGAVRDGR